MDGRNHLFWHIEHFIVRLGSYFCAKNTSPLIDLIRSMIRLQTLDVQFSLCSSTSNTSFWALKQILQMPSCMSTSFKRLCFANAAISVSNLLVFAQRQPLVQEIVLVDSHMIQHNGKTTLVVEPIQSLWSHDAQFFETAQSVHQRIHRLSVMSLYCM